LLVTRLFGPRRTPRIAVWRPIGITQRPDAAVELAKEIDERNPRRL
jgi:hypothetical protein